MKNAFLNLLQYLPLGLANRVDVAIPELSSIDEPTDETSAIVAQGILAYNLNKILLEFVGLTPIALLLRAGQLNPVYQGILLASLETYTRPSCLSIDAPAAGAKYYGGFLAWQVTCSTEEAPESVTGLLDGEPFELTGSEKTFTAERLCLAGDHFFEVMAKFESGATEKTSVAFRINSLAEIPTTPANGATVNMLSESELTMKAFPAGSLDVLGLSVKIGDETINMEKNADDGCFVFDWVKPDVLPDGEMLIVTIQGIVLDSSEGLEQVAQFNLQVDRILTPEPE